MVKDKDHNFKPASYPESTSSELKSIVIFQYLIDKSRVKPDIKAVDKTPNTDGYLELVDINQIPLGKIEIQIKTLNKKNHKRPKYQCDKKFIAYCEKSILPVLLILVNIDENKAYWMHINRDIVERALKQPKEKSISLFPDITNVIEEGSIDYIQTWINIIESYQRKMIDFNAISAEVVRIKIENKSLLYKSNNTLTIPQDGIKEIQYFLDKYNMLLDLDFNIIKQIFYPDIWKIGFAYSEYSNNHIEYSTFLVEYGSYDFLIKELSHEERFEKFRNYRAIYGRNPIINKAIDYAYKIISEHIKELLDYNVLKIINSYILDEYLTSFIDNFNIVLGLKLNLTSYSIEEFKRGFSINLNEFMHEYTNRGEFTGLIDANGQKAFNIDYFNWHVFKSDLTKDAKVIEQKISQGQISQPLFLFESKDFDQSYILKLLDFAENAGIKTITRPYPKQLRPRRTSYFIWEKYTNDSFLKLCSSVFTILPDVYDSFVKEYFPNIFDGISFFMGTNWLVVLVDFDTLPNEGPSIELAFLKSDLITERRVSVYSSLDKLSPFRSRQLFKYYEKPYKKNSISYITSLGIITGCIDILSDRPLENYVFITLKDRLKNYLNKFTSENEM